MRSLILVCAIALCGCDDTPYATTPKPELTANNWEITKLFEFDGCSAFYARGLGTGFDGFKYVVCDQGNVRATWERSYMIGKTRRHETVAVDTVTR